MEINFFSKLAPLFNQIGILLVVQIYWMSKEKFSFSEEKKQNKTKTETIIISKAKI